MRPHRIVSAHRVGRLVALLMVAAGSKRRSGRKAGRRDQIATDEGLVLAPMGSLGRDAYGRAVEKDAGGWYEPGSNHMRDPLYVHPALPVTLYPSAALQMPLGVQSSPAQRLETV